MAIVGAGPSGFYAAGALLQQEDLTVSVDLFDRLPAPFGLVRYGVAPDHQKIKMVARVFDKTARDARVRFFGNVSYGRDLSHDDLLTHYDQVIYAVGGQSDRKLNIPGEDLEGSYSSTAFVYWYSGHPDWIDLDVSMDHETVAVVGIGNVAMDVSRILARPPSELEVTDIADPALDILRDSRVRDIHVLARRGPVQAKCTAPELKELGEIEGVHVVVDPKDLELDPTSEKELENDRQAQRNMDVLREYADQDPQAARTAERRIHLRFLTSPVEILDGHGGGEEAVTGVRLERNRLEPTDSGYLASVGTGEHEILPATLVVRAVGYRSVALPDVPFHERWGIIPNRDGRILDPETDRIIPREYVVGWVKRGPTGLIGTNKVDAVETVEKMMEDVAEITPAESPDPQAIETLLLERGIRYVEYHQWQTLDELETRRGKDQGRPRVKFCRVDDMLSALDT